MTAVLYTACFGQYDDLGLLAVQEPEVECVCFTDDPQTYAPEPWHLLVEEGRFEHPRMSAKWYKLMPHVLFPEHETSVYVDASMHKPHPGLVEWALSAIGPGGFAAFRHPYFEDSNGDARLSASLEKYRDVPVMEQVAHYQAEGFPDDAGHFATGMLARRHHDVRFLDELWFRECLTWTYQDQLSLPFVAWLLGTEIATFDGDQLDNPFISPGGHRRQD